MAWARAENAHGADIYIRPARGMDWPMVFLDDVAPSIAQGAARDHGGLAIQTSPAGGCHLWLPCARTLCEEARHRVQRWLAESLGGDLGSVSGEHLGRLAGFKNWKRGGCWVNVLVHPEGTMGDLQPLAVPEGVLDLAPMSMGIQPISKAAGNHPGWDSSPSGQEWGWACRMLESGWQPDRVYKALVERAWTRRGPDAERYAHRTVERALAKVLGRQV
jgi:hypothetical protein